MEIVNVNKNNFKEEVLDYKGMLLVDFYADWCGPCKMLRKVLDEIVLENDNYKIVSVNVDSEDELALEYNIMSIPCLILFKDGKEIKRSVGLRSKSEILDLFGGN